MADGGIVICAKAFLSKQSPTRYAGAPFQQGGLLVASLVEREVDSSKARRRRDWPQRMDEEHWQITLTKGNQL